MNRRKADLALVFNAVIWGSTFILVKEALGYVSPLLFLAIRFSRHRGALLLFRGTWRGGQGERGEVAAGALAGVFLFGGLPLQPDYGSTAPSRHLTGRRR